MFFALQSQDRTASGAAEKRIQAGGDVVGCIEQRFQLLYDAAKAQVVASHAELGQRPQRALGRWESAPANAYLSPSSWVWTWG